MSTTSTGHCTHAVVGKDRTITLADLPMLPGEEVDVILLPRETISPASQAELRARLRGLILRDDDPFGPAAPPEDWESMR